MKKYRNLLLLIPFLVLFSCMEDESEYSSQEKENVQVDQVTVDTTIRTKNYLKASWFPVYT